MCLKKLRKKTTPLFEYDFEGWTDECLRLNREVVEDTIREAHNRENVIYSRVGSLLALNGVILAVICTLISRANIASDSLSAYMLTGGVCALIFSVLILGFLLVPSSRISVNPKSCITDSNYRNNCKNATNILKAINGDRIAVSEDIVNLLENMSFQFSISIMCSAAGLGLIGSALTISLLDPIAAIVTCSVMAGMVILFSIIYMSKAKV